MKTLLNYLSIILSTISFAYYYEIKGPFTAELHGLSKFQLDEFTISLNPSKSFTFYFYHDPHTGFILFDLHYPKTFGYYIHSKNVSKAYSSSISFMEFKGSGFTFEMFNKGKNVHQNMSVAVSKCIDKYISTESEDESSSGYKPKCFDLNYSSFRTSSGLRVENQSEQLILIKNNQAIDFREELFKYVIKQFDKQNSTQKIIDVINYGRCKSVKSKDKTQLKVVDQVQVAAQNIVDNDQVIELLTNSTILNALFVLRDDRGRESIIGGQAKRNDSNKEYYWVADLKNDVSVLFKQ